MPPVKRIGSAAVPWAIRVPCTARGMAKPWGWLTITVTPGWMVSLAPARTVTLVTTV